MTTTDLNIALLQSLGLSEASAKLVMGHINELNKEVANTKRKTLLEASSEVASHWNDRTRTVNQYEQAVRSAGVLQKMAFDIPIA